MTFRDIRTRASVSIRQLPRIFRARSYSRFWHTAESMLSPSAVS